MIDPRTLLSALADSGVTFCTGVPDSLLKDFLLLLDAEMGRDRHVIAANEGAAIALGAGRFLASGDVPLVYFQNSGLGNAINPLLSLTDPAVYGIPMVLLIGWRGEPGKKDEPQHMVQGTVTEAMLALMGIPHQVLDGGSDVRASVATAVAQARDRSGPVALLCRAKTFSSYDAPARDADLPLSREAAIGFLLDGLSPRDVVVATTGHISRELFELRRQRQQSHDLDFLTVGSMGHASQIALGVALSTRDRRVFCFDGDGAVLMHMGSLAVTAQLRPRNFIHVVLNNGVHDSVGGQPTAAFDADLVAVATACGYRSGSRCTTETEVRQALERIGELEGPVLLEIRVRPGARADLGRPAQTPREAGMTLQRALRG